MREITTHKVNPANDQLQVHAFDNNTQLACHNYTIVVPDLVAPEAVFINFQNGPIAEAGVNGVTHEALLAIIVDRLEAFQKSPFACRENALALTKIQEAQHWLHHRTRARMDRGVEGTHEK